MEMKRLYVIKRNGKEEEVNLDKITIRIRNLCDGLNMNIIDPVKLTLEVIHGIYPGVSTVELDNLAAEKAALKATIHPDYALLAARIAISNLYREIKKKFSEIISDLYNAVDEKGHHSPLIAEKYYKVIQENAKRLDSAINYERDTKLNYFSFKILLNDYLMKINGKVVEVPQQMLMRVSVGIHSDDIDAAIETYNLMSEGYFIHSSCTLRAAATPKAQMASSFIVPMPDDSLEGIFTCVNQCALLTKTVGSLGLHIHNIRAKGTLIAGTGGESNGLVPMLRVFNNTAICVEQGNTGKYGDFTIYLEPWHADIQDFLNLKKFTGKDEYRAKALNYALWVPDLFMKRVKNNEMWSLMCPHQCPGLSDCYGEDFEKLYRSYEEQERFNERIPARHLWKQICSLQMETGGPFIVYKDACNRKSNQKNLGIIKSGDSSTESIQYSTDGEIGTVFKAMIALNNFISNNQFNFNKLKEITKILTKNLNKLIDNNCYPLNEAKESCLRHRPISIGVQGLADTFILLKMPYESAEARRLNQKIFETLYYGALEASCELAKEFGHYSTFKGSLVSKGLLQYDLWNVTPSDLWNWTDLKENILKYGIRNSLLIALMPTTNIGLILGNSESIEPLHSNVYVHTISTGLLEFVNYHLIKDLSQIGLWDEEMHQEILANNGSIQNISQIPKELKDLYKTVWEISQKSVIDMAADRGAFVDQSQAMNIFLRTPTYAQMSSMHFYGWDKGLKTGLYNLKFKSVNASLTRKIIQNKDQLDGKQLAKLVCSLESPGACDMCSA